MAAPIFNAHQLSASEERGAIFERYIAGETLTIGQPVYLDSNNKAFQTIDDSAAHATAIGLVMIADNFAGETTIVTGGTAAVVIFGPVFGFTGLNSGTKYYVAAKGLLDSVAPIGGAYQYVVGFAQEAETFFVDPGMTTPVSHA